MISRKDAIRICAQRFPEGPEHLARRLKVTVCKAPLQGVEGWCVRGPNTVIRVNSLSSPFRQRFTMAHELAHLVLGTKPDIASEPFQSSNKEERDADQLASEFLIPNSELCRHVQDQLPVDAKSLRRLAKAANVSPVMAACRLVSATKELGLQNAAVVFFVSADEKWRFSQGLSFDEKEARNLLIECLANKPNVIRAENHDGNVIIGSLIDAQAYQVLLIQLLPKEMAVQETREERRQKLVTQLFEDDHSFRQSIAGTLSTIKQKCKGQHLDDAVRFFESKYLGVKYKGTREKKLRSNAGREYIRLCLERWFT